MTLGRFEICEALEFKNWTGVETWINDVAWDAFVELRDDYLQQFADRGEKSGHGSLRLKEHFAENSRYLFNKADQRVEALCNGVRTSQTRPATKTGWGIKKHYTRFIVEAIALDRFANRVDPTTNTISNRWYASNPMRLICIMYELTEAICHNYWKPKPADWASDDSDIPYTE